MIIVIKIGGAALEDAGTLRKCARAIAELAQDGHRVGPLLEILAADGDPQRQSPATGEKGTGPVGQHRSGSARNGQ